LSPYLTVPASALCVAAAGAGIGWLTLRLRGPYFALSTIALSAVLYKFAFIFSRVFGGEEGISGVDPFASDVRTDFFVCLALFVISVSCLCAFARSHYGLILRSTRGSEDAAQSSGINTAYYKVVGCAVSGFFAGIGGAMYAHANMQIGPSMLAGSLSVFVVLLATIGGRGTILGPVYAAASLTLLNEWLRVVDQYRIVIFTATVITLVYLYPSGLVRARAFVRAPAWFRRFLLGPVD
jgi:branched-chain amino acid transport system permease protein